MPIKSSSIHPILLIVPAKILNVVKTNIQPRVSIITINYNAVEATLDLLDSLSEISYPAIEIIVVDNASKVNPKDILLKKHPEINLILSDNNLGFAGGNNLAIEKAEGEYLLFVNNDAILTKGCIEALIDTFNQKPDAGMVSPKFHFYNQPGIIEYAGYSDINSFTGRNVTIGSGIKDSGQFDTIGETHFCHGGGMMIPKKIVDEVGPMPEEYFLYYEEFDWCEQIKKAGYKIYYQPKALIRHKVSVSIGNDSPLKTYYLTRNRILFMRRNKSWEKYFIFLIFLFCITVPKNCIVLLARRKFKHLNVFLAAVLWNFGFKKEMKFN